jgi:hypothetical protein
MSLGSIIKNDEKIEGDVNPEDRKCADEMEKYCV